MLSTEKLTDIIKHMKIIIGLGNPGKKYENTWHNIGFLTIDDFIKENNFPELKKSEKFNALISEKKYEEENIILAKPETYMNESGKAVKSLMDFYKLSADEIIIIHDDIDLLAGKIKISTDRGSAGHKGAQSIFDETKHKDFTRIRIGISPDFEKSRKAESVVLKKIGKSEEVLMEKSIKKAVEAINTLIKDGLEKAMNKYNV